MTEDYDGVEVIDTLSFRCRIRSRSVYTRDRSASLIWLMPDAAIMARKRRA
jgi:hypothetical protein